MATGSAKDSSQTTEPSTAKVPSDDITMPRSGEKPSAEVLGGTASLGTTPAASPSLSKTIAQCDVQPRLLKPSAEILGGTASLGTTPALGDQEKY